MLSALAQCKVIRLSLCYALASLQLSLTACEPKAEVQLEGGTPPAFSITGMGKLWFVSVGEYTDDRSLKPSDRWRELWRIEPETPQSGKDPAELAKLTYGIVPAGYRQLTPARGEAPQLIPGKDYTFEVKTDWGMPATGDFEIRDGKAVRIKSVGMCLRESNGKTTEVPCEDTDPQ
ncbi:MAG: hypothetical protein ACJ741_01750 [Pyrinomonadaceae bacterium]